MVPRLSRLIPLCVATVVLPLVTTAAARPNPPRSGVLALHNTTWDRLLVEVRLGQSTECDLYPSLAQRALRRGETWVVVAGEMVCWRQEQNPGREPIVWTTWRTGRVPSNGVNDVTL